MAPQVTECTETRQTHWAILIHPTLKVTSRIVPLELLPTETCIQIITGATVLYQTMAHKLVLTTKPMVQVPILLPRLHFLILKAV